MTLSIAKPDRPQSKQFSIEEYHQLLEIGFFKEDDRIELVRGDLIRSRKPEAQDVLLLIEVADSSLEYERTTKGSLYAEAAIDNYWIFNVLDRQLEVYKAPFQNAKGEFEYSSKQIYQAHQTIDLPDPLTGTIAIADLL